MKKHIPAAAALAAALLLALSGCTESPGAPAPPESTYSSETLPPESAETDTETDTAAASEESPQSETLPPDADGRTLYVTGLSGPGTIRSEDRDASAILARVDNGTELKLISMGRENAHVLCESKNVSGYIKKHYLTEDREAVCEAQNYYVSSSTSLYDSRDDGNPPAAELKARQPIVVLAKTSGGYWYVNVKDTDLYGYVKTAAISSSASGDAREAETDDDVVNGFKTGYGSPPSQYTVYYANVDHGYLAVRNRMAFDTSNELGHVRAGDPVYVISTDTGTEYWYCYVPYPGIYGFVNAGYLTRNSVPEP